MTEETEQPEKKKRELIEAGWHRDLSNERYHGSSGTSSTTLKKLAEKTPAHLLHDKKHPKPPSPAMRQGTLLHTLVLEPDSFEQEFIMPPDGLAEPTQENMRSFNAGTARAKTIDKIEAWEAFLHLADGKEIINESMLEKATRMAEAVHDNETAMHLLEEKIVEQSIYWWYKSNDPESDVAFKEMVKVRPDALSLKYPMCMDLKSCVDASYTGFQKAIMKYHYHISAAMYLIGINQNPEIKKELGWARVERFVFICVESEPPYEVASYDLHEDAVYLGQQQFHRLMLKLHKAKQENWPGYDLECRPIELPKWAENLWIV